MLGTGYRILCMLGSTPPIELNPQPTDFLLRLAALWEAPNWNLEISLHEILSPGMADGEVNEKRIQFTSRECGKPSV